MYLILIENDENCSVKEFACNKAKCINSIEKKRTHCTFPIKLALLGHMSVVKLARRREEVAIAGSGVSEDSRLGAEMGEKEAVIVNQVCASFRREDDHKWFLSFLVVFRIFLGAHDPLPNVVSATGINRIESNRIESNRLLHSLMLVPCKKRHSLGQ